MTLWILTWVLLLTQDPTPADEPETESARAAAAAEDPGLAAHAELLERLAKIEKALVLLGGGGAEREKRLAQWALSELDAARVLVRSPLLRFEPPPAEVPAEANVLEEGAQPQAEPGAEAEEPRTPSAAPGLEAERPTGTARIEAPDAPTNLSKGLRELIESGDLPTPWTLEIPQPSTKKVSQWGEQFRHPVMEDEWHAPVPGTRGRMHALLSEGSVVATRLPPLEARGLWLDGDHPRSATIRWGGIAHGAADWTFRECLFKDIHDEHGLYLKSCWDLTFERCRFENIGSQGIQVVWRDHEAKQPELCTDPNGDGKPSQIRISECVFHEVGQESGGRPSYAISLFERQPFTTNIFSDVTIERCWLQSERFANNAMAGGPWYSFGAIMVHGRSTVVLDSNVVRYKKPNRAIVQIWNCGEVIVRGGEYTEGLIDIRNCEKVTIEGVSGGAQVQVGEGKMYTPPISRELEVVYRGPVTKDWKFGY